MSSVAAKLTRAPSQASSGKEGAESNHHKETAVGGQNFGTESSAGLPARRDPDDAQQASDQDDPASQERIHNPRRRVRMEEEVTSVKRK